jgi:hypothetical protein
MRFEFGFSVPEADAMPLRHAAGAQSLQVLNLQKTKVRLIQSASSASSELEKYFRTGQNFNNF